MKLRANLLALLLLLTPGSALSQDVYRLAAADQIEIWSSLEPSLRRVVTIGPDGWVSLPLAGHFKAAGMTVPELETVLHERVKGYFKQQLDLTVMLQPGAERSQTIYVAGDVETPGSYPFRAGMLVLHGISVAGGLYRGPDELSAADRGVGVQGEMKRQKAQLVALSAQIARITAEIEGADIVADGKHASAETVREQNILEAHRAEEVIRNEAHAQALHSRQRARDALAQRAQSLELRIEIAGRRLAAVSKLVSQGFANESQQLELEGDIAELRGNRLELEEEIAAAELEAAAEIAAFDASTQERRTELVVELRDAQLEIEAVRSRLADNEQILQGSVSGALSDFASESQRTVLFTIVRLVDGRPVEMEATDMSEIQAGDLVRVAYVESGRSPAAISTSSVEQPSWPRAD